MSRKPGKKIEVILEDEEVEHMFDRLLSKDQDKALKYGLRKAAKILEKEAKKSLVREMGKAANSPNWWNGKALKAGIKVSADRNKKSVFLNTHEYEGKVHIMGDFRLKFFEMGTNLRYRHKAKLGRKNSLGHIWKKSGTLWGTGKITPNHFFTKARMAKEEAAREALKNEMKKSIQRAINKK